MRLTWLGAAGFKLDTSEGATLLIDPYLSRPKEANPRLPVQLADLFPIDEIFLTNGRFDHGMDTPALTKQTGAIVHASEVVCQRLADRGVSAHCLQSVVSNKPKSLGSLTWEALPSLVNQLDSSLVLRALTREPKILPKMRELDRAWPVGEMVAFVFRADEMSLVHFGSAGWIDSEIEQLRPDFALLPVEGDLTPDAAVAELVRRLRPKVIIPHHWDDYFPPVTRPVDRTRFEAALRALAPEIKVFIPTIGQSFDPATLF